MRRAGRIVLIIAIVLFFAATGAAAGRGDAVWGGHSPLVQVIKVPVMLLKHIVVTQAALERHMTSLILHLGVETFTSSLRFLAGSTSIQIEVTGP